MDRLDRWAKDKGFASFAHWRLVKAYRLRLFFRYRWKWLVCGHRRVELSLNWTGCSFLCLWCHKHLPFDDKNYRMVEPGFSGPGEYRTAVYEKQPVTPGSDRE